MQTHDGSQILEQIKNHCISVGRNPQEVRVIAVSKLQPLEKIRNLHASTGHKLFGENYVQEALEKQEQLQDLALEWHLIGHLQRKKINSILGRFEYIHSIDSLSLSQTLAEKCQARGLTQKILLEVNVAEEKSKEGWLVDQVLSDWSELEKLSSVQIVGLMTMPPAVENAEDVRPYFRQLKQLQKKLQTLSQKHSVKELSMGTSQDYLVAIEEGATFVRIGSKIFGERLHT